MKAPRRIPIFEDRPLLERWGLRWMRRFSTSGGPVDPDDPIHLLTHDERTAIRSVERRVIFRAAAAGAVTALIAALTELWLRSTESEGATLYWGGSARYWTIFGIVVGAATIIEMLFLYWDSLRSVHRVSALAGHELFGEEQHAVIERALVRAALELPNSCKPVLGVDPQREVSRWRAALMGFVYKLKVGLTNFLLRTLLRRALGRVALRSWIPFVAIPVTGLWNGLITWWVMREARVRVFGPSAVADYTRRIVGEEISREGAETVVQGVASAIVKTRDRHPNVTLLLGMLMEEFRLNAKTVEADVEGFLNRLKGLDEGEARLVLQTVVFAALLDGRVPKRERELVRRAFDAAGRSLETETLKRLKGDFLCGREVSGAIAELMP